MTDTERLAAATADLRKAAARAKRAVAKLYPVGCRVEFVEFGKKHYIGEVIRHCFSGRTGEAVLSVRYQYEYFNTTQTTYSDVPPSRVLRVLGEKH